MKRRKPLKAREALAFAAIAPHNYVTDRHGEQHWVDVDGDKVTLKSGGPDPFSPAHEPYEQQQIFLTIE
jgi:hypothetical protein